MKARDLVKLRVVTKEFTEPFIKEYLSYGLTNNVLKMVKSKTAREEAYQTFLAMATNDKAKNELKEIHENNTDDGFECSGSGFQLCNCKQQESVR